MTKILALTVAVGLLLCFAVSVEYSQVKLRNILDQPLHSDSPIIIVSRALGNKMFGPKSGALGDHDWIRNLTFSVKNVSNKNIVYFNIDLAIPKKAQMPGPVVIPIYYGNRIAPQAVSYQDLIMRAGDIVKVSVSPDEMLYWDNELRKYGVDDFDRVTLDIRVVHFDDGTGWQMGIPLRQDPSVPKTWKPQTESKPTVALISANLVSMFIHAPLISLYDMYVMSLSRSPRTWGCSVPAIRMLGPPPPPDCGYFRGNEDWNNTCVGFTDYVECVAFFDIFLKV